MKKIVICLCILISSLFMPSVMASSLYGVKQIFAFNRVGQIVLSPQANKVSFIILRAIHINNKWRWQSSLYIKNIKGKATLIKKSYTDINNPVWSKKGDKLYYLAQGNHAKSIWVYDLANKHNKKLFETKTDIETFKFNPNNSNQIAFVASDINKAHVTHTLINPSNVSKNRIYLLNLSNKRLRPITPGNISIAQYASDSLLDGGFSWSPDGKYITYSYQPTSSAGTSNQAKIATYNVQTRQIIKWPYTNKYVGLQPVYSPNGNWVAFHASSRDNKSLTNNPYAYGRICVLNVTTRKTHCLDKTFNESPTIIGWNQNGRSIYVADDYKTDGPQLYQLSLDNKYAPRLISNKKGYIDINTLSYNPKNNITAFSWQAANQSPGLFYASLSKYHLNHIAFAKTSIQKIFGQIKIINWKSKDGLKVQGELILPNNYNKNKSYPLVVIPHGGPINVWSKRYLGGCEEYGRAIVPNCMANLLSMGFVIFKPNYRGSTGYGKTFRFANVGDLGGGDEQDIMSGVNLLIKEKIADPKRMAIFGWSYGGYLTAWTISQTHRFRAAIDGDGLTDFISFTGTTDIPWYLVQYLGGTYWQKHQLYVARSPITFVNRITTPILILQGQNDTRVPPGQAYELYNNLRFQHKTARLLISPKQGHVPTVANISAQLIREVDTWLQGIFSCTSDERNKQDLTNCESMITLTH